MTPEELRERKKLYSKRYRDKNKLKTQVYRAVNKERYTKHKKAYYERNKTTVITRSKQWALDNPEKVLDAKRKSREKHRAKGNAAAQNWKRINKEKVREYTAFRRAQKKLATPKWVNRKTLREIYKNCPEGFEVDHIIPLVSDIVCGLHIPENLQYLPKTENRKKSNKVLTQ